MLAKLLSKIEKWALSKNKPGTYRGEDDRRWAYTIDVQGDKYLTRIMLPRILGWRAMLHHFHRPDQDRWLHDHPWRTSYSVILAGSYDEERLVGKSVNGIVQTILRHVRLFNKITDQDFHKVTKLHGDVWTLFITGERVQDWGFLVNGKKMPWREYLGLDVK
jgi:hypothetical protein